jgi:polyisoprenoid-binding protein YceI
MNVAPKAHFTRRIASVAFGASTLVATFVVTSELLSSNTLLAQAPQTAPVGPGTAVVQPGVRKVRFDVDQIPAGTYDVDTRETLVRYGVDHMGFSEFWGTFPGATGTLVIDPKSFGATKIDVKVPIAQVETTNRELNGQLFSDEFFDAEDYPWMKFSSSNVVRTGPNSFKLTGDLTMHNITKPIVLNVTFHGAGNDPFSGKDIFVGFDANGMVKRSDFGLGKYVPIVSDETTITISVAFKKRLVDAG